MVFNLKNRVVAPKVQARLFRLHQDLESLDEEISPQRIGFVENTEMKHASENGEIKGVQHERTALYGDVAELNLGENAVIPVYETSLPNDHLEIFYKDIADLSELGSMDGSGISSFLRSGKDFSQPPKFAGPIWKPHHVEKPSQFTTQLNAWGYSRIMQYYNIPRGKGSSTKVKLTTLDEKFDEDGNPTGKVKARTTSTQVSSHNDLLDYIDHAVELYLGEMYRNENATVMSTPTVTVNDDQSVKIDMTDLAVRFFKVHKNSGVSAGIQPSSITDDYPSVNATDITSITTEDRALQLDTLIADNINERLSLGLIRFMDAKVKIATSYNGTDSRGKTFRVVGEIIAIDQFGLAQLLTGSLTYDYGINNWYTPIVDWDVDFISKMESLSSTLSGNTKDIGRLVYVRFRAGEITGDRSTVDRKDLNRIAVFNKDSFGDFMKFFTMAPEMNFSTISRLLTGTGLGALRFADVQSHPSFLSLVVSAVDFPQSRYASEYTLFVDTANAVATDSLLAAIADGTAIDTNQTAELLLRELKLKYLKNSTSWASLIASALRKDDKFVSFMTNIPASYMRADVFTGSKYKTFSYDSLSIIRVIQILSSTMGGFPATNNPVQATGGSGTNVDNYPVFLANRVIIEPEIIFAQQIGNREYKGQRSVSRYFDVTSRSSSVDFATGFVNSNTYKGYFFLRLKVGVRLQVDKRSEVDFKIPIGNIEDLSLTKGAAINHLFTFSFAENMEFLKNLSLPSEQKATLERSKFHLEYRLGGQTGATSLGASPPELNILTLQDMTQKADYHPLLIRSQPNPGIKPQANGTEEFPVHNPVLAWSQRQDNPLLFYTGLVVTDFSNMTNTTVNKADIISQNGTRATDINLSPQIIGVSSYVDISDLQRELITLINLATNENIAYSELSNSRSEERLLDLVKVVMPFDITLDEDNFLTIPNSSQPQEPISITKLLEKLEPITTVTAQTMAWKLPISGYYVSNLGTPGLTADHLAVSLVSLDADPSYFQDHMQYYAGVVFLDLLIKGIRYMLWTLSKSRFLGHVYLPADHFKYAQNWQNKLKNYLNAINPNDLEAQVPTIDVGSSIIFDIDEGNQLRRSIVVGGTLQKVIDRIQKVFGTAYQFAKKVITGTSAHPLTSFNISGDDAALIWYVAKKTVYIGQDVGYMMRLNLTEGSFDWTLFFREDTTMTRFSEYYLMNGMNNFFLSRGGQ